MRAGYRNARTLARKAVVAILLEDGDIKPRAHALSLDAAIVAWNLSIRAIGSGCRCADRYVRSHYRPRTCIVNAHLCGNWQGTREFAVDRPTLHERLQLLANERR